MEMITICNHTEIVQNPITLEYVCSNCAEVLRPEYVDSYSTFDSLVDERGLPKQKIAQYIEIGNTSTTFDKIGSNIGFSKSSIFRDINGKILNGKIQNKFRKYSRYNKSIKKRRNSRHINALNILGIVVHRLGLSAPIYNRAGYLYKKIVANTTKKDITNHIVLVALCLRLAINEEEYNAPINLEEMTNTFIDLGHEVTKKLILRMSLDLKPIYRKFLTLRRKDSEDYIQKIVSIIVNSDSVKEKLEFDEKDIEQYRKTIIDYSILLLKETTPKERGGRNPYMIAVASVYGADRLREELGEREKYITQKDLAKLTNTSDCVIRDHWCRFFKNKIYKVIQKRKKKEKDLFCY